MVCAHQQISRELSFASLTMTNHIDQELGGFDARDFSDRSEGRSPGLGILSISINPREWIESMSKMEALHCGESLSSYGRVFIAQSTKNGGEGALEEELAHGTHDSRSNSRVFVK